VKSAKEVRGIDAQQGLWELLKLLIEAAERIRPGGAIVYSTCSMEPEENRQVVDNVLRAMSGLEREAEEEHSPGQPADGGYWARLRRKSL
jgi:16S rRNA (cytosine967-C5)-methyltransferase